MLVVSFELLEDSFIFPSVRALIALVYTSNAVQFDSIVTRGPTA